MPHPLKGHWSRDDSEPVQDTSSIQMVPLFLPNSTLVETLTAPLYPSCLHTTWVHAHAEEYVGVLYHPSKPMLFLAFASYSIFIIFFSFCQHPPLFPLPLCSSICPSSLLPYPPLTTSLSPSCLSHSSPTSPPTLPFPLSFLTHP